MESILWIVKSMLFLAMELFVISTLGTALIAGLYQAVRDRAQRRTTGPTSRVHLPSKAS
jgi:hypothetical protein